MCTQVRLGAKGYLGMVSSRPWRIGFMPLNFPQRAEEFQEPRFQEPNRIQVRKNQTAKDRWDCWKLVLVGCGSAALGISKKTQHFP